VSTHPCFKRFVGVASTGRGRNGRDTEWNTEEEGGREG